MRPTSMLALLLVLSGCDLFSDPPSGDPLYIATSGGTVLRLDAGEEEASQAWSSSIDPSNDVTLVLDGEDLFVASGGQVAALDTATGEGIWPAPVDFAVDVVNLAGPIQGTIFALTFDDLVALDAGTGQELWRQDLNLVLTDAADEAVAAAGDALVLAGDPVRSLDPLTGDVLAEYDTPSSDIRALVVTASAAYVGLGDGLVGLGLPGLAEQWVLPAAAQVDNVALGSGTLAYSILGGGIAAASAGGTAAGAAEDGEIFQHVAVDAERLYGVRADGFLAAWDLAAFASCTADAACATAWEVANNDPTADALVLAAPNLYLVNGGILDAIDLGTGAALWSYQTEGAIVAAAAP